MEIIKQENTLRLDTKNYTTKDIELEVKECVELLKTLGVDLSKNRYVCVINSRLSRVLGNCKYLGNNWYRITLSAKYLKNGSAKAVHGTIMHEVCHSAPLCMNHGPNWKNLTCKVNNAYGYSITRCTSDEEYKAFREATAKPQKYVIFCETCNKELCHYERRSPTWSEIYNAQIHGKPMPRYCKACGTKRLKALILD